MGKVVMVDKNLQLKVTVLLKMYRQIHIWILMLSSHWLIILIAPDLIPGSITAFLPMFY
jgi:hypothetical protein